MIHSEAPYLHMLSAVSLFTAALFPVAPKVMTETVLPAPLSIFTRVKYVCKKRNYIKFLGLLYSWIIKYTC